MGTCVPSIVFRCGLWGHQVKRRKRRITSSRVDGGISEKVDIGQGSEPVRWDPGSRVKDENKLLHLVETLHTVTSTVVECLPFGLGVSIYNVNVGLSLDPRLR